MSDAGDAGRWELCDARRHGYGEMISSECGCVARDV